MHFLDFLDDCFGGALGGISLTYDDGMDCHLDIAMPALEACRLRGSFYAPMGGPDGERVETRLNDWQSASKRGHEIGNHTLVHPCRNCTWTRSLCAYSLLEIEREIADTEARLTERFGAQLRSFAYPCCDTTVGPDDRQESYIGAVRSIYRAARLGGDDSFDTGKGDLLQVPSLVVQDGVPLANVINYIDGTVQRRRWGVLMFHGVGEQYMKVSVEDHQQICEAVAAKVRQQRLCCTTFAEMANQIVVARERKGGAV